MLPAGARPSGRYGHTLNILGSKIYIFGGQVEGYFMNDLSAFDLNTLQAPNNRWEMLIQNTEAPAQNVPAARTNHTMVAFADRMYLYVESEPRTVGWFWFACADDFCPDLAEPMATSGSTTFGATIPLSTSGLSSTASATFRFPAKATLLHLSTTSCTCLAAGPRRATTSVTLLPFASRRGGGIRFKTWVRRRRRGPVTA